jgi:hypothetical protein
MTVTEIAQWIARAPSGRLTIGFLAWWYPWARAQLTAGTVAVPCDGCGAQCCRKTDVFLLGLDDAASYDTVARDGRRYLARRADGACVHLDAHDRCTVHAHPPLMCRAFDCRSYPAAGIVIAERGTDDLTLACEAGLTRFDIVARTEADRAAKAAAHAEAVRLSASMEAAAAMGAALLTWPRRTGGPAAAYLRDLERRAGAMRQAVAAVREI